MNLDILHILYIQQSLLVCIKCSAYLQQETYFTCIKPCKKNKDNQLTNLTQGQCKVTNFKLPFFVRYFAC